MKKKTYKAMKNKLYKAMSTAMHERAARIEAEERAEFYRERFMKFGTNVETVDPGSGKAVVMEKWTVEQQPWGMYAQTSLMIGNEQIELIKERLAGIIAKGLIEKDIVQFTFKEPGEINPLSSIGTIGAKLYVVPWEQMPHKRTIELKKYVENTLSWTT